MPNQDPSIPKQKSELRKHFRAQRQAIPAADRIARSKQITQKVLEHPKVISAQSVFIYLSQSDEVHTLDLVDTLLELGKTVAVPKIIPGPDRVMLAIPIKSRDEVTPDILGIPAPPEGEAMPGSPAVIIMPGLGFTPQGQRLGQGGSYYDRYLTKHPGSYTFALAYREQVVESLPTDTYDRTVDKVLIG